MSRPIHAVNLFVKAHHHEADLSFAIDYESSDYVPKVYGVWVTHVIFNRWISDEPKHWIAIRGGKAVLLPGRPLGRSVAPEPETWLGVGRTSRRVGGLASRPVGETADVPE
jgi:hypothetical protein